MSAAHAPSAARPAPPLIEARDLALLAGLAGLVPLAWAVPARHWPAMCSAAARLVAPVLRARRGAVLECMSMVAGSRERALACHTDWVALRIEAELQYLREYRPGGWRPRLELAGREHLEAAVRGGAGAILWIAPMVMAPLIVKKTLAGAGFCVSHLSRDYHGPSDSRFGRRVINPVSTARENRYLQARFAMQAGLEARALRPLVAALKRGEIISITCAQVGRRLIDAPLLGGRLPIAAGAASLALSTGAPLLPVALERTGARAFAVRISPPLPVAGAGGRDDAMRSIVHAYAHWLDSWLGGRASHFADWRFLRADTV